MNDVSGIATSTLALLVPLAFAIFGFQSFRKHSVLLGVLVAIPTFAVVLVAVMFGGLFLIGDN